MKKMFKLFGIYLMLSLMLVACSGKEDNEKSFTEAQETTGENISKDDYKIELKLSHVFAPGEQLTKSIDEACEAIREKTNGAVDIKTYPQGQLATYKDGLEQVAQGANFISVEDPSYIGDYVPDFKALVGPHIYTEIDQYTKMIETDLVKDMKKQLEEEHNIKVLALDYVFGFRNMYTNKLIETPDDLKGLKIRVPGSQIFIDTINAMGANAVGMPFGETLSAVQQGVVDGLEGTVDAMRNNGSYEVCKNVAFTKHFLGTCGVYINNDLFNEMPKEYQDIVLEEFDFYAKDMTTKVIENYDRQKAELEEMGVEFNDVDIKQFQEKTKPVFDTMEGISDGIYEQLMKEIEEM